ncbi:MAG: hypothetical protein JOZ37_07195 [Actinobacteria bacterium]|nr:hypothetical protein [Actinomycetota bacterium]
MAQPGVIFGGPSPEHDISVLTGLQAAQALDKAGRRPIAIYWAKTGDWFEVDPGLNGQDFQDGVPRKATPVRFVAAPGGGFLGKRDKPLDIDAAVNCCHGGPGEDGSLQGALDLAGIKYTGPSMAGAALGMDKLAFGAVITGAGLPSLPRVALDPEQPPSFDGPYLVKPRFGGSSIGIETVADFETARLRADANVHLRAGGVVEPYRPESYDLQIAVRSWPELQLSAIERPLRSSTGAEILNYADKYVGGEGMVQAPRELPAQLEPAVEKSLRDMAARVATLAGLRGVARIDFLVDGDQLYVNEINTIPGSLSWYLWVDPSIGFDQLLADMLTEAVQRPASHYTTAGADGTALRAAGSIASKLG